MRVFGFYTIGIGTIGVAICYFFLCYPIANPENAEWFGATGKTIIIFYICYAFAFFKIIILKHSCPINPKI